MTGPVESRTWPDALPARAVEPGPYRRIFGYDVERDVAKHYAFSDSLLLGLTGELPDDARSRAFAAVLTFASAMSVRDAPMHAAVLSRICGVRTGGILAVALLALGEHIDALLRRLEPLFADAPVDDAAVDDAAVDNAAVDELPAGLNARDDDERRSIANLRELLGDGFVVPLLAKDLGLEPALLCVLRACGLVTSFQMCSALSIARLPSVLAEVVSTKVGDFKSYPMDLPHFEYDPALPPGGARR